MNYFNLTSKALASMCMTYNKLVKIPNRSTKLATQDVGWNTVESNRLNNLVIPPLSGSAFHWPLNTICPRLDSLAVGCWLYLSRLRQSQCIIKFLKALTKTTYDPG